MWSRSEGPIDWWRLDSLLISCHLKAILQMLLDGGTYLLLAGRSMLTFLLQKQIVRMGIFLLQKFDLLLCYIATFANCLNFSNFL